MNTNSKHYEELNIQPWEIMERNFTTEEFVAYLKGNIIKYTLRDKGQDLTDAEKIKHYAEKLIEVLEKKEINEFLEEDAERIYGKHKFKVGDRVRVLENKYKGTIIRTPTEKYAYKDSYLICLDWDYMGWTANKDKEGIDAENVWQVRESGIELLQEEPKKTLKPNKWYDAEDFTAEGLKELLPVWTKVVVTYQHDNKREVDFKSERLLNTLVKNIGIRATKEETRVGITADCWWRRYFKIVEEN
jgi:hypothetical protein